MQKLVTVDSSIIVSALVEKEARHHEASEIWEKVIDKSFFAILPYTILVEVVSAVNRRTGNEELAENVLNFLISLGSIQFVDVNSDRSIQSSKFAIDSKTRGMDAIIIEVAKEFGTELVTFDEEMRTGFHSI